jgi:hypothetical protein
MQPLMKGLSRCAVNMQDFNFIPADPVENFVRVASQWSVTVKSGLISIARNSAVILSRPRGGAGVWKDQREAMRLHSGVQENRSALILRFAQDDRIGASSN